MTGGLEVWHALAQLGRSSSRGEMTRDVGETQMVKGNLSKGVERRVEGETGEARRVCKVDFAIETAEFARSRRTQTQGGLVRFV